MTIAVVAGALVVGALIALVSYHWGWRDGYGAHRRVLLDLDEDTLRAFDAALAADRWHHGEWQ